MIMIINWTKQLSKISTKHIFKANKIKTEYKKKDFNNVEYIISSVWFLLRLYFKKWETDQIWFSWFIFLLHWWTFSFPESH